MAIVHTHRACDCGEVRVNKPVASFSAGMFRAIFDVVWTWQGRMSARDQLREADPRLLSDMGISVDDAREEAKKPFWRD